MFSWLNKQGVKSNKGFIVQSMSRFTIEYSEDSRSILVTVDNGQLPDGRFCEIISHDAFSITGERRSCACGALQKTMASRRVFIVR